MAKLTGTPVAALIVPDDSADPYATHDEAYGAGGYRTVATITDRNAITTDRRRVGMRVLVLDRGDGLPQSYVLGADLTTWAVAQEDQANARARDGFTNGDSVGTWSSGVSVTADQVWTMPSTSAAPNKDFRAVNSGTFTTDPAIDSANWERCYYAFAIVRAPLDPRRYGAKADLRMAFDGAINAGTNVVSSYDIQFSQHDIGKLITIWDAGPNRTTYYATIANVSGHTATVSSPLGNAARTVSAQYIKVATDDTLALARSGLIAAPSNAIERVGQQFGGRPIKLGLGSYGFTASLYLPGNASIEGNGGGTTQLVAMAPAAQLVLDDRSAAGHGGFLHGFGLDGNNCAGYGNPSSWLLDIGTRVGMDVEDVAVGWGWANGSRLVNSQNLLFKQFEVRDCGDLAGNGILMRICDGAAGNEFIKPHFGGAAQRFLEIVNTPANPYGNTSFNTFTRPLFEYYKGQSGYPAGSISHAVTDFVYVSVGPTAGIGNELASPALSAVGLTNFAGNMIHIADSSADPLKISNGQFGGDSARLGTIFKLRNASGLGTTLLGLSGHQWISDFSKMYDTGPGTGILDYGYSYPYPAVTTVYSSTDGVPFEQRVSTGFNGPVLSRIGQYVFPETAVPSTNPNVLDWFGESISFQPTLSFGGNSVGIEYGGIRTGWYVKIGRLFVGGLEMQLQNKGTSTGLAKIALPFNVSHIAGVGIDFMMDMTVTSTNKLGAQTNGVDGINLSQYDGSASPIYFTDANFTNSSRLALFFVCIASQ